MLLTIVSFAVVFSLITLAHEFGHLICSKLAGIRVPEFGLGFGPTLASFKFRQTTYKLNLLPILGYVKIAGLDPEDPEEKDLPPGEEFYNKGTWAKFFSIFGGPLFNLILGFLILTAIFSIVGSPAGLSREVATVSANSPASEVGLKPGDLLFALNGKPIESPEKTIDFIHKSAKNKLSLTITRNGKKMTFLVTPKYNERMKVGLIGFSLKPSYQKISLLSAVKDGAQQTAALFVLTLVIVGKLFTGQIGIGELAGPVGIAQITGQYASVGIVSTLSFVAFFSVNVAVLNLIPLPALDGGRLFFVLLGGLTRRPINIELENKIHAVGMTLLLTLMAVLTLNDILRLFRH